MNKDKEYWERTRLVPVKITIVSTGPIEKTCTVQDLINALEDIGPEKHIYTEGCDCTGSVQSIQVYNGAIVLCRYKDGEGF